MGVWSWICPKPVLKVAGKTIIENLSRKNTDESYFGREKGWKNACKCHKMLTLPAEMYSIYMQACSYM